MGYFVNDCPHCSGRYEVDSKEIGRRWPCPHCGETITLLKPVKPLSPAAAQALVVLRWVAVLPGALAYWVLAGLMVGFALTAYWGPIGDDDHMRGFFQGLFVSVIQSLGFVGAGSRIAPSHRFITTVALTVIHAMLCTALVFWWAYLKHPAVPLWLGILIVLPSIGATVWLCSVAHENPEFSV